MTLRTLNYGNYGIFFIMGTAGFCPSTVVTRGLSIKVLQDNRFMNQEIYVKAQKPQISNSEHLQTNM